MRTFVCATCFQSWELQQSPETPEHTAASPPHFQAAHAELGAAPMESELPPEPQHCQGRGAAAGYATHRGVGEPR